MGVYFDLSRTSTGQSYYGQKLADHLKREDAPQDAEIHDWLDAHPRAEAWIFAVMLGAFGFLGGCIFWSWMLGLVPR